MKCAKSAIWKVSRSLEREKRVMFVEIHGADAMDSRQNGNLGGMLVSKVEHTTMNRTDESLQESAIVAAMLRII